MGQGWRMVRWWLAVGLGGAFALPIDGGSGHTCVLLTTGAVRCWGRNDYGQLGYGHTDSIGNNEDPSSAGDVSLGAQAVSVATGAEHSCAVLTTGAVRCWGRNNYGQLGIGSTTQIGDTELPTAASAVNLGGATAVTVVAGSYHTCALLSDGSVRCWGKNDVGQLGIGSTTQIGDTEAVSAGSAVGLGGVGVKVLTAGGDHACAILVDETIRCWGRGTNGQLGRRSASHIGDDELPSQGAAAVVGGSGGYVDVSAGLAHTCVVTGTGAVRCWGSGGSGRLGYRNTNAVGLTDDPSSAGDVNLGGTATNVTTGDDFTCALLTTGAVRCWGSASLGRLGYKNAANIGDTEYPSAAGDVSVSSSAVRDVVAGSDFACAILSGGTVRCWGNGASGRLGYGNVDNIGDNEFPSAAGDVVVGGYAKATCPAGGYLVLTSMVPSCTSCIAGTYSQWMGATSSSTCTSCPAGTFSVAVGAVAASTCSNCLAGTYSSATGSTSCTQCGAGKYLPGTGASSESQCSACGAGKWSATTGATAETTCQSCAAGRWSASTGLTEATQCTACEAGKYSSASGATSSSTCADCIAGKYSAASGATSASTCTDCTIGRYSSTVGASSFSACLPCAAATYAASSGATACTSCPAGTYTTSLGLSTADACTKCAPGKYSTAEAATSSAACQACGAGKWGAAWGAATEGAGCTACPSGRYSSATGIVGEDTCVACGPGTYGEVEGATASTACTQCQAGRYSSAIGANSPTTCTACPAGTYSALVGALAEDLCTPCQAGRWSEQVAASAASTCTACPAGTYGELEGQVDEATGCTACPEGTYSSLEGAASATTCLACPAGTFQGVTGATAVEECQRCPPGTWSDTTGATSNSTCLPCPAGTYSPQWGATSASTCMPCHAGSYSAALGAESASLCIPCSAGRWASVVGADSADVCTDCPAGTYSPLPGAPLAAACVPCPAGSFSSMPGATEDTTCQLCPAGRWSDAAGATADDTCVACAAGRHSSVRGAVEEAVCSPCPAGRFSTVEGGDGEEVCEACVAGRWSALEGAAHPSTCSPCPAGTYSEQVGAKSEWACRACAAGTWSEAVGANASSVCAECGVGEFAVVVGAATEDVCELCAPGTFSTQQGAFTSLTCSPCPKGTFAESYGATECVLCPAGTFSAAEGASAASTCSACPAGRFSSLEGGEGEEVCEACVAGRFSDSAGATDASVCSACPVGTWSAEVAANTSLVCLPCRAGHYGTAEGADGEEAGCATCPTGRFSASVGAESNETCLPCAAGNYSASAGATECLKCRRGYWSSEGWTECLKTEVVVPEPTVEPYIPTVTDVAEGFAVFVVFTLGLLIWNARRSSVASRVQAERDNAPTTPVSSGAGLTTALSSPYSPFSATPAAAAGDEAVFVTDQAGGSAGGAAAAAAAAAAVAATSSAPQGAEGASSATPSLQLLLLTREEVRSMLHSGKVAAEEESGRLQAMACSVEGWVREDDASASVGSVELVAERALLREGVRGAMGAGTVVVLVRAVGEFLARHSEASESTVVERAVESLLASAKDGRATVRAAAVGVAGEVLARPGQRRHRATQEALLELLLQRMEDVHAMVRAASLAAVAPFMAGGAPSAGEEATEVFGMAEGLARADPSLQVRTAACHVLREAGGAGSLLRARVVEALESVATGDGESSVRDAATSAYAAVAGSSSPPTVQSTWSSRLLSRLPILIAFMSFCVNLSFAVRVSQDASQEGWGVTLAVVVVGAVVVSAALSAWLTATAGAMGGRANRQLAYAMQTGGNGSGGASAFSAALNPSGLPDVAAPPRRRGPPSMIASVLVRAASLVAPEVILDETFSRWMTGSPCLPEAAQMVRGRAWMVVAVHDVAVGAVAVAAGGLRGGVGSIGGVALVWTAVDICFRLVRHLTAATALAQLSLFQVDFGAAPSSDDTSPLHVLVRLLPTADARRGAAALRPVDANESLFLARRPGSALLHLLHASLVLVVRVWALAVSSYLIDAVRGGAGGRTLPRDRAAGALAGIALALVLVGVVVRGLLLAESLLRSLGGTGHARVLHVAQILSHGLSSSIATGLGVVGTLGGVTGLWYPASPELRRRVHRAATLWGVVVDASVVLFLGAAVRRVWEKEDEGWWLVAPVILHAVLIAGSLGYLVQQWHVHSCFPTLSSLWSAAWLSTPAPTSKS